MPVEICCTFMKGMQREGHETDVDREKVEGKRREQSHIQARGWEWGGAPRQ